MFFTRLGACLFMISLIYCVAVNASRDFVKTLSIWLGIAGAVSWAIAGVIKIIQFF